jgi:hypothetical protein
MWPGCLVCHGGVSGRCRSRIFGPCKQFMEMPSINGIASAVVAQAALIGKGAKDVQINARR